MNIEKLVTVLSVSRLKSFSEAAFELDYSQSSVSRHIQSVEKELGVRLFNRSATSATVTLTDACKRLIEPMQKIVNTYNELVELVDNDKDKNVDFTLGLPQFIFPSSAQSTIQSYLYINHPEIAVTIKNSGFMKMADNILARNFDAYFSYRVFPQTLSGPRFAFINDKLSVIPLARYDLRVCMNAEHPLANREFVEITDLKNETFLCNSDTTVSQDDAPHKCFLNLCESAGFKPLIKPIERSYKDTKLLLTYTGKGVFLSFTPYGLFADPRIRCIPIMGANYYAHYFIAYDQSRSKSKVVKGMADIFRKMIEADGFFS